MINDLNDKWFELSAVPRSSVWLCSSALLSQSLGTQNSNQTSQLQFCTSELSQSLCGGWSINQFVILSSTNYQASSYHALMFITWNLHSSPGICLSEKAAAGPLWTGTLRLSHQLHWFPLTSSLLVYSASRLLLGVRRKLVSVQTNFMFLCVMFRK